MPGYQAITLAQLRTRLQEMYEGVPFWTTTEATDALNEGLRFWNALTGRWKTRIVIPTTPGPTLTYLLPAPLLYRARVTFNGIPMSPSSREDLLNGRPHWYLETTASGQGVPTVPTLFSPRSLTTIDIWPMDAVGGNSLMVDGVAETPVLVADTDFVDLAEADVSNLLGYALHCVSLKKGGPWFQSTMGYFLAFLKAAGEENDLITTSQMYRRVMGLDNRWKVSALPGSSVSQLAAQIAKQLQAGG